MKSYGGLFPEITSFENLLAAARKAKRGKSRRPDVAAFWLNLERHLVSLQQRLREQSYVPGGYRTFVIYEPKKRLISAAPFEDRVVHHALIRVIGPRFERRFLPDSFANQEGKGTHRALGRVQSFVRQYRYLWKADIASFFPSMDHEILYEKICRVIRCPETRWLVHRILDSSNPQDPVLHYFPGDDLWTPHERRRGLPIGNLTSQFWANVYLDAYDHFAKDDWGLPGYARYVDDFVAASDSHAELRDFWRASEEFLARERLKLSPRKTRIYHAWEGLSFVGFHLRPDRVRVRRRCVRQFRFRMRAQQSAFAAGQIGIDRVRRSVHGWIGHVRYAHSVGLRKRLLARLVFQRDSSR